MKILLDTNAYVGFKLNQEQAVNMIAEAEHIYFSPVVLGDLMFGFRNGSRFAENMQDLNHFLRHETVELNERPRRKQRGIVFSSEPSFRA